MRLLWQGGDRYQAEISLPSEGDFTFAIESYDHPLATWLHDAEIKIKAGIEADLMCASGATLFKELIAEEPSAKSALKKALAALENSKLSALERFNAASDDSVKEFLE
jgi:starch synthase (maltosyl-transferring)